MSIEHSLVARYLARTYLRRIALATPPRTIVAAKTKNPVPVLTFHTVVCGLWRVYLLVEFPCKTPQKKKSVVKPQPNEYVVQWVSIEPSNARAFESRRSNYEKTWSRRRNRCHEFGLGSFCGESVRWVLSDCPQCAVGNYQSFVHATIG